MKTLKNKIEVKTVGIILTSIFVYFLLLLNVSAQGQESEKEKEKTLEYHEKALLLNRQHGDKQGEAATLNNIGLVYDSLGKKQKALESYNQALQLRRQVGDKIGEAATLSNIGLVFDSLGEKQKALDYFNKSLLLAKQFGSRGVEIITLNNIGRIYDNWGDMQKALEFYNQALLLSKQIGDKGEEAKMLNNIGRVYDYLGEKQKALEYYNQAFLLARRSGIKIGEVTTLNNIGRLYDDLGEKQKAFDYLDQALLLAREFNFKYGEATTLHNIGELYASLAEKQKALDYYDQALVLRRQIGDKSGEAATLNNIGLVFHSLGKKQEALEFYNQALVLRRKFGEKSGEANALNNIGGVYFSLRELQKALGFYNQALLLKRQVGLKDAESGTLINIGGVYSSLGQKQKAIDYFKSSLLLSKSAGNKAIEANALYWLMYHFKNLNHPRLAAFYGKQSVNILQGIRTNIQEVEKQTQQVYLKSIEIYYRELAENLISDGRLAEAHQVLNSFKDQQFFDFDHSNIKKPTPLVLTAREAEFVSLYEKASQRAGKVRDILEEHKRTVGSRQPTAVENVQLQKLEREVQTVSDEFLAVLKRAETEFSKKLDEKDKVQEVPDLKEMQATLRNLTKQTGRKAVAVYQVVGEENFSALVITPDSIDKVSVLFKGEKLNEKALQLWALLKSDRYDTTILSKEIYDVVFASLEAKLPKDTTTIMWSLDGNLRYLPMTALFDGKRFLVERYTHSVFTRADSGRMERKVSDSWTGTGFGGSNAVTVEVLRSKISFYALPGVKEELSAIFKDGDKGVLKGEIFADREFSKPNFIKALKQGRPLIHIASHFSFRPGDEARSFLLMGNQTVFTLEEMKREENLFKGVELLTLSACNTAVLQPNANGREIDGFAELAQRLGAGAVMATLWEVSDASTPWLMRHFYAIRESKTGMSKAEALQKSQLELLNGMAKIKQLPNTEKSSSSSTWKVVVVSKRNKRSGEKKIRSDVIYLDESKAPLFKKDDKKPFAHPYYWSPFILFGNWK